MHETIKFEVRHWRREAEIAASISDHYFRLRAAALWGIANKNSFDGARLDGASLDGASLDGASLVGARPVIQIGPIGSRGAYLVAYITDHGVMVRAGCFCNTLDQFALAVERTYGDGSVHGREYAAAIAMIRAHAELWTPAAVADQAAEVA